MNTILTPLLYEGIPVPVTSVGEIPYINDQMGTLAVVELQPSGYHMAALLPLPSAPTNTPTVVAPDNDSGVFVNLRPLLSCGPPPLITLSSIQSATPVHTCSVGNIITEYRVVSLPGVIDYNAIYYVKRDSGGDPVIDTYMSSGLPCDSGGMSGGTPQSEIVGGGSVVTRDYGVVLTPGDTDTDTHGVAIEYPMDMAGIPDYTLRFRRQPVGSWVSNDHTTAGFIITLSPTAINTYDVGANGYHQVATAGSISISLGRDETTDPIVYQYVGGSQQSVPTNVLSPMGPYVGTQSIDIYCYNDEGKMGIRIYYMGEQRVFSVNTSLSVDWFDSGSVCFHHHQVGGGSHETLVRPHLAIGDIQPLLTRRSSALPTLLT